MLFKKLSNKCRDYNVEEDGRLKTNKFNMMRNGGIS